MSNFHDDMMASLLKRVNYLERRISNIEVFDNSFGLPSNLAYYTGTPTASQFAVWTGAGTLSGTALNTSSFVISQGVLGGQQVAGDTAISGSLHIYGTHYSAGTGNPALTAIYFAPSRGLTPSLSTRMDHDGDWTFTRNVLVQGTATLEAVSILDRLGHNGDADTAIRFPAVDTVTIETAGTERTRVDSSGLVGINVSPTDAQLDVVSGAAGRHALRLKAAASPTVPTFEIENSSGDRMFAFSDDYVAQVGSVYRVRYSVPSGLNGSNTLRIDLTMASNTAYLTRIDLHVGRGGAVALWGTLTGFIAWNGTTSGNGAVRDNQLRAYGQGATGSISTSGITNGIRIDVTFTGLTNDTTFGEAILTSFGTNPTVSISVV